MPHLRACNSVRTVCVSTDMGAKQKTGLNLDALLLIVKVINAPSVPFCRLFCLLSNIVDVLVKTPIIIMKQIVLGRLNPN